MPEHIKIIIKRLNHTNWVFAEKYFGIAMLTVMVIIGIFNFSKYGVAWDEPLQRDIGLVNYNYVFSNDKGLLEFKDRYYGVAFELPLIILEKTLQLSEIRDVYLMRHLISHLLFLAGAFFCFKLIDLLYKDKLLATIGFLMIVLHPLLYAHSFFNTKDIPFMSVFIICLYYFAIAFNKKTIRSFIVLGVCTGLLINLRIMGVLLPFCALIFLFFDSIAEKKYLPNFKLIIIFLASSAIVLFATWPYSWTNPFNNFASAFLSMAHFRWEKFVLFNGESVLSTKVPWNYIPVWFSITTPILYLVAGLLGAIIFVIHFLKKPFSNLSSFSERNNLVFLICCFSPVLIVIVFKSVLYDSWRQLFFIYPSFVMLAVFGLNLLFKKKLKIIVATAFVIGFGFIGVFMIQYAPFQHVYINQFISHNPPEYIRKTFELDYWGTSYRQSLEYILEHDTSRSINVYTANDPGIFNSILLSDVQKARLNFVSYDEAKYFITNYRWHPDDYTELNDNKFHAIKVENNTINEIFKLK